MYIVLICNIKKTHKYIDSMVCPAALLIVVLITKTFYFIEEKIVCNLKLKQNHVKKYSFSKFYNFIIGNNP